MSFIYRRATLLRPREVESKRESTGDGLARNMSLFDLLMFGIGGSIGSGVFVLSGLIANKYAGPAVPISFLLASISCLFSAGSFGELSCRIPSVGSSYAYAYETLGEYPAVIAAWCLFLEYGISGAAVARAWGEKLDELNFDGTHNITAINEKYGINVFAGLLQFVCVIILLCGVNVGKLMVNAFTLVKIFIILFMIICGFTFTKTDNLVPFFPFGASGVIKGATVSMFSYIGYDEVCCLAAEATNPQWNLPVAVFGTIISVGVVYCLASLALVSMQPYTDISTSNAYGGAFYANKSNVIGDIAILGELLSLPVVVLISFIAQPRIQYALAQDGLLPRIFRQTSPTGNLTKGILIGGALCTLIALLAPFEYLNDVISAGVLVSCNLTNTSLISVRCYTPAEDCAIPHRLGYCLIALNVSAAIFSFSTVYLLSIWDELHSGLTASVLCVSIGSMLLIAYIYRYICRLPKAFDRYANDQYRVVWFPLLPILGIIVNCWLIAQQQMMSLCLTLLYLLVCSVCYIGYAYFDSNCDWKIKILHKAGSARHAWISVDVDESFDQNLSEIRSEERSDDHTVSKMHSEISIELSMRKNIEK